MPRAAVPQASPEAARVLGAGGAAVLASSTGVGGGFDGADAAPLVGVTVPSLKLLGAGVWPLVPGVDGVPPPAGGDAFRAIVSCDCSRVPTTYPAM